jgi:hypothetical protein
MVSLTMVMIMYGKMVMLMVFSGKYCDDMLIFFSFCFIMSSFCPYRAPVTTAQALPEVRSLASSLGKGLRLHWVANLQTMIKVDDDEDEDDEFCFCSVIITFVLHFFLPSLTS